jgi:hypothetical protein
MTGNEYDKLPKGMQKLPDEFKAPSTEIKTVDGEPLTHIDSNYTSLIRETLKKVQGLSIDVKRLEVVEQANTSTMVSLLLEVKRAKAK